MKFYKMHGNGNDFIVIDDRNETFLGKESELAKKVCHRHFGIGADGVLLVRNNKEADSEMVIINSDGSYAAMCGNGLRCFIKYIYDLEIVKKSKMKIMTGDGLKDVDIKLIGNQISEIKVFMGKASYEPNKIPVKIKEKLKDFELHANNKEYNITSMLLGVPHTVIFEEEETDITEGRAIEKHEIFPEGTNVNFCEVLDRDNIKVRTWERGAGATLACGTGNCAAAVAAFDKGYTNKQVKVHVPGGVLEVLIETEGVYMIGNAEVICNGEVYI